MNKKEAILESALELLVVNGVHATPMSVIAKHAGTGMGTIYNYFETKEILINAVYVDIKKEEKKLLLHIPQDKSIKVQFEYCYSTMVNFFCENQSYFLFLEQLSSSPLISEESIKEGYEAMLPVIEIIKRGQQEGIIKDINIEELLQFIGASLFGNLRWIFSQSNKSSLCKNNQFPLVWDAIRT